VETIVDYSLLETLNNNLDKYDNNDSLTPAEVEDLNTEITKMAEDVKVDMEYLETMQNGTNTAKEDIANVLSKMREDATNVESTFSWIEEQMESKSFNHEEIANENQRNIDEMQATIVEIQEEIERARSLVKQLSRKNDIGYTNDHTVYDDSRIPKSVDFTSQTSIELMLKANALDSHVISLVSTDTTEFFSVEVKSGKVRLVYQIGENTVSIDSTVSVFDSNANTQKWFKVIAERSGGIATLMVNEHGSDQVDVVENVGATGATYSRIKRETAKLFVGGVPAEAKPAGVSTSESNINVHNVRLNGETIYLWDFVAKSDTFDKSDLKFDTNEIELPTEKSDCDDCWQFSGEDSWVYINEKSHAKYLVNKESGTIMFQLKLKAPIYADGLIFFIGDPMQTEYFIAMDLLNGQPRFLYNLGYEKGPTIVTLREDQVKYIPTNYGKLQNKELNFRIGMVGGVAGLAVQEWRANNVVSVENDFWLKQDGSKNCQGCEFKLTNEMHFGGIKALGRDLSHLETVLPTWNKPYRGCMGKTKINHQVLQFNENLLRSNVMEGCRKERIRRISLTGNQMIKRDGLTTSIASFTATFAIALRGGYHEQDSVILRVKSAQGPNFVEFGMKKDPQWGTIFYYEDRETGIKDIIIKQQVKADEQTQISITRNDGVNAVITIGDNDPVNIPVSFLNAEPEEVTVEVGGRLEKPTKEVTKGFLGCITSPYISGLKSADKVLTDIFDGFKCIKDYCINNVRFNECPSNIPHSLVDQRVNNEVITVMRENVSSSSSSSRGGNRGRKRNRQRGRCPKMTPIDFAANKYQIGPESMVKLHHRNIQNMFQKTMKLQLRILYKQPGSVLQMVNEDCSESISILIFADRVSVIVKINNGQAQFSIDNEIPTDANTDIILQMKQDDKNPDKTKFTLSVHGKSKTKRLRKDMRDSSIKSLYIGKSPGYLQCSDLQHIRSFTGYFYGATVNGVDLKKKRFENTPAILTGSRIPGIFLGKRDTAIDIPLQDVNFNTISFTLRAREDNSDIFTLFDKTKGNLLFNWQKQLIGKKRLIGNNN